MSLDSKLDTLLKTQSIVSFLVNFNASWTSYPAIFNDVVIPKTFKKDNSINYYTVSNFQGGLEYDSIKYTVNCRSNGYVRSRAIQEEVFNVINRVTNEGAFFRCDKLPVIPPRDETDNYNAIVEILLRN